MTELLPLKYTKYLSFQSVWVLRYPRSCCWGTSDRVKVHMVTDVIKCGQDLDLRSQVYTSGYSWYVTPHIHNLSQTIRLSPLQSIWRCVNEIKPPPSVPTQGVVAKLTWQGCRFGPYTLYATGQAFPRKLLSLYVDNQLKTIFAWPIRPKHKGNYLSILLST